MEESRPTPLIRRWSELDFRSCLVAGAYSALGVTLLWSRLFDLGHSFWFDELYFVSHFVREGPAEILGGPNLSHELYGLLAWLVSTVVGDSETAFRLLSAVPFITGVVVVTAWLHIRFDPIAGVLYLFLATVSPLLLDLSRQARGYGLAYLAMSVLVVAALEVDRSGATRDLLIAFAAGVAGTWTLPQLGVAFVATGLVLCADPRVRRRALAGLVASGLLIAGWYAPHISQVRESAQLEAGSQIPTSWVLTAPIDQILIPALIWIEGVVLIPGVVWLPLVLAAVLVMASSPLLRRRQPALILCAGPAATVTVLWISQAFIFTRYLSYLLVPSFILVASGATTVLRRPRPGAPPAIVRSVICLVAIGILAVRFVSIAPDVVRLPREANRDAADVIEKRSAVGTPIFVYTLLPEGLAFYLDRPFRRVTMRTAAERVCSARRLAVYVTQPMTIKPVEVPCLRRPGARHYRFRQFARGDEMNVWFVPPS